MRNGIKLDRVATALAIAILAMAAIAFCPIGTGSVSAQPLKIWSCASHTSDQAADPQTDGAPTTGPDTADAATGGNVATPLWCVNGISDGSAPASDSSCGATTSSAADPTVDASTRGFGWVC